MSRKIKTLGLMLTAALAVCAVAVVSAAQAEEEVPGTLTTGLTETKEIETENGEKHIIHVINPKTASLIHGKQYGTAAENYFEINNEGAGHRVECTNSGPTFTAKTPESGEATELTVNAEYKQCTGSGLPAKVKMNGCDYEFLQPHTIENEAYTGKAALVCPEGAAIEVEAFLFGTLHNEATYSTRVCKIKVSPKEGTTQVLGGHIVTTNVANHEVTPETETEPAVFRDVVTIHATVEGIHYVRSGTCGALEGNDGVYKNTITAYGTNGAGEHHDIKITD